MYDLNKCLLVLAVFIKTRLAKSVHEPVYLEVKSVVCVSSCYHSTELVKIHIIENIRVLPTIGPVNEHY